MQTSASCLWAGAFGDSCPVLLIVVWAVIDQVQPFAKVYTHFI